MNWNPRSTSVVELGRTILVLILIVTLAGDGTGLSQTSQQSAAPSQSAGAALTPDQLDALVAPIALYPDPLLSQTLVASTYPLEVIQLQQWMATNKDLKGSALTDAVKKQDWDPSIQALASLPEVAKLLAENIKWTTDLGNAFLAQQSDVMEAAQRMRKKAKDAGNLKSSEQQKVETKVVEQKNVIVIEQANPQVVYVPSYNPTVVYGPPVYAYPPIAYPPPGYYAAGMAISFGVGIAMGAAMGGGWGWGCGWGHNDVNINVNNNFVRNSNVNNINNRTGNNTWQHNPQHRGGTPYSDRATASKYGGAARGDSTASRQANARQDQAQRGQQGGVGDRGSSGRQPSTMDRGSGGRDSGMDAGNRDGARGGSTPNGANRGGSGGDRVGNQGIPSSPSASNRSAFGGAGSGTGGGTARASSQRGASSMGASRSGGGGRRR
jgi:hypothetical protein